MSKLNIVKDSLQQIINNIDVGNSNLNDEQCEGVLEMINIMTVPENKYSKYQACKYLRISRATFDNWVRSGKLPKGRKQQGFKELYWLKRDLDVYKN